MAPIKPWAGYEAARLRWAQAQLPWPGASKHDAASSKSEGCPDLGAPVFLLRVEVPL